MQREQTQVNRTTKTKQNIEPGNTEQPHVEEPLDRENIFSNPVVNWYIPTWNESPSAQYQTKALQGL
jgi:hypothetical protein